MLVAGPWPHALSASGFGVDPSVWPESLKSADDDARFARYAAAQAFHDGAQWEDRSRRGEHRLVLNYARTLIRKSASYVFPAPVTFTVIPDSDDAARIAASNEAEWVLNATLSDLDIGQLDLALAIDASVLGDAAIKVTWDTRHHRPVIAAVDPGSLIAHWRPDNPRELEAITHGYGLSGAHIRQLFPDQVAHAGLDPGRRYAVLEHWTPTTWQVTIAGQPGREVANPYGWIPYVVAANNPRAASFWGMSDLADLVDVCREINGRMTVLSRILELSGAPIAVLENVDGSAGISVGPGAKWELPEGARAYLLDLLQGGSPEIHLAYIDHLFRILHDLSETPRTAFGDSGRDLSGAALEVEIQPLIQKVGRMRRMWDGVFQRRNAMVLDLLERFGGLDVGGLRRTTTIWPPILPSDIETSVRNAVSLVSSGIQSRRSALVTLGYTDPDGELGQIASEREAAISTSP